jgi:anti-sigma factor RsiW
MNCNRVHSLLTEFADDTLDAGTAWQVQTHLAGCDACRTLHREMVSVKQLLHTLPSAAPSAGFDAALAQRLALTRRPAAPAPAFRLSRPAFRTTLTARRLRPALALSLLLAAGAAAFFPGHAPKTAVPPAAHAADPAFVADCVAQHHRDAAAEPLADMSAQTLAGNLDSAPADASADPNAPAYSSLL